MVVTQLSIFPFKKKSYSDEVILEGIRNNQNWAVREIYKTFYPSIKTMVYSFRNIKLEPEDIFQEGLTRMILNIQSDKFKGNSSLLTYLNGICRNVCLKMLEHSKSVSIHEPSLLEDAPEDNYYELLDFINKQKEQLKGSCKEIIDMRFLQTIDKKDDPKRDHQLNSFDHIAKKLEISSDNARQRFKRCLDQLRNLILEHPDYLALLD